MKVDSKKSHQPVMMSTMNAQLKYAHCANCEHVLIDGVACDCQPYDCPQLRITEQLKSRKAKTNHLRVVASRIALPGEYDAVRSEG